MEKLGPEVCPGCFFDARDKDPSTLHYRPLKVPHEVCVDATGLTGQRFSIFDYAPAVTTYERCAMPLMEMDWGARWITKHAVAVRKAAEKQGVSATRVRVILQRESPLYSDLTQRRGLMR